MKLLHALRTPFPAAALHLHTDYSRLRTAVEEFGPSLLWLESYTPALPATALAEALNLPLYYRSHNIEHRYLAAMIQAGGDAPLKTRLLQLLTHRTLEKFERTLLQRVRRVYDISPEDAAFWRQEFPGRDIRWLPPFAPENLPESSPEKRYDFLFVGNLFTPNNRQALRWLIREIMPRIRKRLPGARLTVAGSSPGRDFSAELSRFSWLRLLADFDSPDRLFAQSRVVLNPILRGSGVNLKSVDALASGTPWVGTPQAMRGLPESLKRLLPPAGDARTFADRAIDWYRNPSRYPASIVRSLCRDHFEELPARMLAALSGERL